MKTSDAIKYYGTPKELAKALGRTIYRIYQFGEDVPELLACKLQILTDGKLMAYEETKDRRSRPRVGRSLTGAKSRVDGSKRA